MRDLCRAVGEVLLEHWDPIGVAKEATARDESESYALVLGGLAAAGAGADALAARLLEIERREIGPCGDCELARAVGEMISRPAASRRLAGLLL